MELKKRSKGSVWEFCYAKFFFGTFGFEMKACGQKLVKCCTLTHIHTTAAKLVVRILLADDLGILDICNSAAVWRNAKIILNYLVKVAS